MSTGYASGMRRHRVTILNRRDQVAGRFGINMESVTWEDCGTVWASVDFAKGMRSLNAGALDAYAVVLVRMNWNNDINMRSRIVCEGITYQVLPETFHIDQHLNIVQFNAQAIVEKGTVEPITTSTI